jgi:nitroimidazol reductase NimA-like FMN-containing flavoprotein (pyridoxamine 5'-phosphate oxidase superfamily)
MLTPAQADLAVSILNAAPDLTIATIRPDGYPQATTVSFVSDGLRIYFGAGAQSQKAQNIARDNRVSAAVTAPYKGWEEIRGVSLAGRAAQVTNASEQQKMGELMLKKFPQVAQYIQANPQFEMTVFRIDAEVISLLDYSKGFGHTELCSVR